MQKKIIFVLSGNISTTPRALHAAIFINKHYQLKIIGIDRNIIWRKLDENLINQHHFVYESLPIYKKSISSWIIPTIFQKLCNLIYPFNKKSLQINIYASNKIHYLLWNKLKKESGQYDLVMGFSSSSLFPAWKYSKYKNIPFTFDVEDYYPGEYIELNPKNEKIRREAILKELIPSAKFITYASPMIGDKLLQLINKEKIQTSTLINNCFFSNEFAFNDETKSKINFVWFSQNISYNRGLEILIPELALFSGKIHLNLIGNINENFKLQWVEPHKNFITTHPPMPQQDLNRFICKFDIGLAIEPGKDSNNLIAVSNKIWAYLQSGLYILASNTPAQIKFMEEHKEHGLIFDITTKKINLKTQNNDKIKSLHESIDELINDINKIRNDKQIRFDNAKKYAYENEWEILNNMLLKILYNKY